MTLRTAGLWLSLFSLAGCGDTTTTIPSGTPSSRPTTLPASSGTTPTSTAAALPDPGPPAGGPVVFHHFASETPPAANAACPPLPAAGVEAARVVAGAARKLACDPAFFYKTVDEVKKALALPAGHDVSFAGPSAITISFPTLPAKDLASALGVKTPNAVRGKNGAWSFRSWFLTDAPDKSSLDGWKPGRVVVGLRFDDPGMDLDVAPLGDATTRGDAIVSMPPEILALKHDDVATKDLVAGLSRLARDPSLLAQEPEAVAKAIGLADERFRVARRSTTTAGVEVKGIDVWTSRTQIGSAPIVAQLALPGSIEALKATDTDDFVLYEGKAYEHAWHGVEIAPRFRILRSAERNVGPSFVLSGVTVMPLSATVR